MAKAIPLLTNEARLKRAVRRHLKKLGFTSAGGRLVYEASYTKDRIRMFHSAQRSAKLVASRPLVARWNEFKQYFADGNEVDPLAIRPSLELIDNPDTWQSKLFAFASLYWSVPTSSGYGRRMRFLCWDESNGKLIGIAALGDPVFNLTVRDAHIGWSGKDRKKGLSSVMDAYVLGALPPYNQLLCGKMLACLLKSRDVFDAFYDKYYNYKSIISGKKRRAKLALITTSSSLGRSSIYNRLRLQGEPYFVRVGETKGFGHFHIPNRLFVELREYIGNNGHKYADGHKYGGGSNWRMRVIREAFAQLGLPPQILRHGIAREVFVCETASNSRDFLRGSAKDLEIDCLLPVSAIADLALERWIRPRAERRSEYLNWNRNSIFDEVRRTGPVPVNPMIVAG